jgi:hypothetical protein
MSKEAENGNYVKVSRKKGQDVKIKMGKQPEKKGQSDINK